MGRFVDFSPDGKYIAAMSDYKVVLWDAAKRHRVAAIKTNLATASAMTFSPDGARLVAASIYGEAAVVDVAARKVVKSLDSRIPDIVNDLAFSADGKVLAIAFGEGNRDGAVVFWDMDSLTNLQTLRTESGISTLAYSPDGRTFVMGSNNHATMVDIDPSSVSRHICQTSGRALTRSEWAEFVGKDLPYDPACRG